MGKALELKDQKFGRLVAMSKLKLRTRKGNVLWECQCDCGNTTQVTATNLVQGVTKSCGCLAKDSLGNLRNRRHGLSRHKLYWVWARMKRGCYNKNCDHYKFLGARGIKVCDEWKNDFIEFYNWAYGSGYAEGCKLVRIRRDADYSPTNCFFSADTRSRSLDSTKHIFSWKGVSKPLTEWAESLDVPYTQIYYRVVIKGFSFQEALTDLKVI